MREIEPGISAIRSQLGVVAEDPRIFKAYSEDEAIRAARTIAEDDLLDLRHAGLPAHRDHRVEVASGLPVDEVAGGVALPGLDQGEVADEAAVGNYLDRQDDDDLPF